MSKRTDNLRALLRQVELPLPPPDFTNGVMRETSPLIEETAFDSHLKTVLQDVTLPEPSVGFTHAVQREIRKLGQQQKPKPIIPSAVWIAIALFLLLCVLTAIDPYYQHSSDGPAYFTLFGDLISRLTTEFNESIIYAELIFASATLLFALEWLLRKGLHGRRT